MKNCYPALKSGIELHLSAEKSSIIIKSEKVHHIRGGFSAYRRYEVQNIFAQFLQKCNGTRDYAEIATSFSLGLDPWFGQILVDEISKEASELGILEEYCAPLNEPRRFRVTGGFDMFAPLHMSYELTNLCNMRCEHCYVSAGPGRKNEFLQLDEVVALINRLSAEGVRVFELTGGECTTHPQFREVFEHAAGVFDLVAVVTNGYLVGQRKELQKLIGEYANVAVQVSIDGTRQFHDAFRKQPGAFDEAIAAIRGLKEHGTIIRVAMSIIPANANQVRDVYLLARDLGVDAFAVAPVAAFGRGCDLAKVQQEHGLIHEILSQLEEFADDPLIKSMASAQAAIGPQRNCGAGWRTFTLDWRGNVRLCLYLTESTPFGNVLRESFKQIFGQKRVHMFYNAPTPGGQECKGCAFVINCKGCFAKAFHILVTKYPECPWRKKWFPGVHEFLGSLNAIQGPDKFSIVSKPIPDPMYPR